MYETRGLGILQRFKAEGVGAWGVASGEVKGRSQPGPGTRAAAAAGVAEVAGVAPQALERRFVVVVHAHARAVRRGQRGTRGPGGAGSGRSGARSRGDRGSGSLGSSGLGLEGDQRSPAWHQPVDLA